MIVERGKIMNVTQKSSLPMPCRKTRPKMNISLAVSKIGIRQFKFHRGQCTLQIWVFKSLV